MPGKCFVLMPFRRPFNGYYEQILKPVIIQAGFQPSRADEIYGTGPIIDDIFRSIRGATVLIADVTGKNPNVNYELGIAHALERPVIILSQSVDHIPFDYRQIRSILYDPREAHWEQALQDAITNTLKTIEPSSKAKDTYVSIVNKKSGKCLEVAKGSQDNGARVQQWAYHGADNQIWLLWPVDNQHFYITAKHSGKCLDVLDRSFEDGAVIQQWDFIRNPNQQWALLKNGDGTYQILAKHSHRCLDVSEASDADGAAVVQFPWHGNSNQRWWLNLMID
ncbi:MAG: RICIN domain-containing protein [Thermoanaerobaculia bacterium]